MRILIFILLFGVSESVFSSYLISSEHSTKNGQAELNSFGVDCKDDCYFTMFLEVTKLDFDSEFESGAMYRVWNESRTEYILFGIDANKKTKSPQITITSSTGKPKVVLGKSELGAFEGFVFKWKEGRFSLSNLRRVKMDGYSQVKESDISFEGKLSFSPYSVEYLFLGVDVKQYIDASSQNINQELKRLVNGT
jgi:hypothetical protein